MILYHKDIKLLAHKCKKPRMKTYRGMEWIRQSIFIDGKEFTCHYDSNMGNTIYFEINDSCYRITMRSEYYDYDKNEVCKYYINPQDGLSLSTKRIVSPDGFILPALA